MIIIKAIRNYNDKLLSEKREYKAVTILINYLCKMCQHVKTRGTMNCSFPRMVRLWIIFFLLISFIVITL